MTQQADLQTLRLFDEKVARLESTGLVAVLGEGIPNVTAIIEDVSLTQSSATEYSMTGRIRSSLDGISQDQIDAFVLTYRMFIQKKDRVSLKALAKVYDREWMPAE